tara:strand:- start:2468 stop:2998 length:531 start_codon:yes stop_codon:yes gene_type:complete
MEEPNEAELDKYIRDRYEAAINYYWDASRTNKNWYKITRSLTVIFGALVTLVASLSSSEIIKDSETAKTLFSLGTPILAASLTIIAGFSQSFQWGSAWQNMVLTAQHLQKEYDNYLVAPPNQRNYSAESYKLNTYVINETESFFERMLGGAKLNNKNSKAKGNETQGITTPEQKNS